MGEIVGDPNQLEMVNLMSWKIGSWIMPIKVVFQTQLLMVLDVSCCNPVEKNELKHIPTWVFP